ncbi:MAG: flagellar hook-length control protein FliK [Acidobacteria bacterium]|nr:flagellar hook-length control protein FliK [Acidobacteriota bacterium]
MRVNLPTNMAQTFIDAPAKSAGKQDAEAASPFSFQMSRALDSNDENESVDDGESRADTCESANDGREAVSNADAPETDSGIAGPKIPDPDGNARPGKNVHARQGNSESGSDGIPNRAGGGEAPEEMENFSGRKPRTAQDRAGGNGIGAADNAVVETKDAPHASGAAHRNPVPSKKKAEAPETAYRDRLVRKDAQSRRISPQAPDVPEEAPATKMETGNSLQGHRSLRISDGAGFSQPIPDSLAKGYPAPGPDARGHFGTTVPPTGNPRTGARIPGSSGDGPILPGGDTSISDVESGHPAPHASQGETEGKQGIQLIHPAPKNARPEDPGAGKMLRPGADPAGEPLRQSNPERSIGKSLIDESGTGVTETKTAQENGTTRGRWRTAGEDPALKLNGSAIRGERNSSRTLSGGDLLEIKDFHDEETAGLTDRPPAETKNKTESGLPSENVMERPSVPHQNQSPPRTSERIQFTVQAPANSTPAAGSGAPARPDAAKPAALVQNEFLSQVSERIHFLIRDGGNSVRIRLEPDQFGHMEIRAESTARGMMVRISAETEGAKSILENNLTTLQQNLQESGVKVDRIQVVLQDFFDAQSSTGHSSKSGHFHSGQNESRPHRNYPGKSSPAEETDPDDADVRRYGHRARFYTVA